MRILVTGSAGFIGTHLCRELRSGGHEVYSADLLDAIDLRRWDVADQVVFTCQPDVVVHLAAQVGRLFGEDDPRKTIEDNVWMTTVVAKAAYDYGARLVYASTSEVYGDNRYDLCDEHEGPFRLPHNLYGLTKKFGEDVCRLYAPDQLTIWRISMPYGPGLPAGRGRAAIVNMLHQAHHRQDIPVHRGAERSWCWVGDTVRAMRLTIERSRGGVFNIGRDDNPTKMVDVARIACDITGAPRTLIREVDPPGRQTVVKRLATKRIRDLGWEPRVDLREGMRRTYAAMGLVDAVAA